MSTVIDNLKHLMFMYDTGAMQTSPMVSFDEFEKSFDMTDPDVAAFVKAYREYNEAGVKLANTAFFMSKKFDI